MTNVLFDTQKNDLKYQFTQGMWFEEPGMTNVLFDIQKNDLKISIYLRYVIRGVRHDQGSV